MAACSVCSSWPLHLQWISSSASVLDLALCEAETCAQPIAEQSLDRVS